VLVVDPETRLRVEEMERTRIDAHLDRLALGDVRTRAEPADEQRPSGLEDLRVGARVAFTFKEPGIYLIRVDTLNTQ